MPAQQQEQASGWFRMMVGDTEVTALYDGHTTLDTSLLKGMEHDEILRHLDALFIDAEKRHANCRERFFDSHRPEPGAR